MLTAEQKAHYENVRNMAQKEMETFDREMTTELGRIKKRLLELQEDKKAVKQILDGASARLGLEMSPPLREINLSDLKKQLEPPLANSLADASVTPFRPETGGGVRIADTHRV